MKKAILNLGKALNKAEQKGINGGKGLKCLYSFECPTGYACTGVTIINTYPNRDQGHIVSQTFGSCIPIVQQ